LGFGQLTVVKIVQLYIGINIIRMRRVVIQRVIYLREIKLVIRRDVRRFHILKVFQRNDVRHL